MGSSNPASGSAQDNPKSHTSSVCIAVSGVRWSQQQLPQGQEQLCPPTSTLSRSMLFYSMLFVQTCVYAQSVLVRTYHYTLGGVTGIVFILIPHLWEHNKVPALSSLLQQRRNPWAKGGGVLSPGMWGQFAPRGCAGQEMGMDTVGWVTCCRHSLGQSQGSHTDGKSYHKLCSDLCTLLAASGPAQPWGPSRSSWGCHLLSAHAWFQSEMSLQHLLHLGIVQAEWESSGD